MTLFLGIDVGTYQSKGVLVDETGEVVAEAARRHRLLAPRPGWAEHDPEADWWGDVAALSRELSDTAGAPEEIAAVAVSAIGPCVVGIGPDGRATTSGILYGVDTRASVEVSELLDRIGLDAVLARSGNGLDSQSGGPKILWLQRHEPEGAAAAVCFGTATTFIVNRLTGERVMDRYTAANYGPLWDADAQDWIHDLAPEINAQGRLPRLAWTSEIVGQITPQAAAETGLASGTPVTAGGIDAAAEAVSVGVRKPGDLMLMYGSTVFVIRVGAAERRDPRLWHAPWLFPGEGAAMAGLATSGTLTHWFRERFAADLDPQTAFATLAEEAAASPPGANGLLLLPYFSGERTPIHDPDARGVLFGLDLTHSRGDVYRAFIEGIAYGTAHVTETYAETGLPAQRIRAVGGGVKNPLWLQATSDATGLAQEVCARTTGAAYGDAFIAALAVGAASPEDVDRWNPVARVIEPVEDPALARRYDQWKRLYLATQPLMSELAEERRT